MELLPVTQKSNDHIIAAPGERISTARSFIEANTTACSLEDMKSGHIIPVFIKDNEPLISHADFVEATMDLAEDIFAGETVLAPNIRLSHPIKGRIPEAKTKPAHLLEEHEKTLYYERMAFVVEIPTIQAEVDGSELSLTIGGVKSYSEDSIYSKKGTDEHFKIFIGFKNRVCTNLCVWSDGYVGNLMVRSLGQLRGAMRTLFENYNSGFHLFHLKRLTEFEITEQQFAHLVGRSRLYNYLPPTWKRDIPPLLFGDSQINAICRELYYENSANQLKNEQINLWKLYNLFTSANKSSYINTFLERSVNAYDFTEHIRLALKNKSTCWYLN